MAKPAMASLNVEAILQKVEWTVLRRLDGLLHGDYRTLFRGFGIDISDLREYQYSDDVRHIDWNVTARLQIPHVRQFVEDREVTAWFVVDLTGSMDYGSRDQRKGELLLEHVATLARLLTKHGNRVGLVLYRGQDLTNKPIVHVTPAGLGRRHVLNLLQQIAKPTITQTGKTDLEACFSYCASMFKRRSIIFVATDFVSTGDWWAPLGQMAIRHETIAVHIQDPTEKVVPNLGLVTFSDPETGEQLTIDTSSATFAKRFATLAVERSAKTREHLARAGVDYFAASDAASLVNFALSRQKRQRRPNAALLAGAGS
jgi:uncharacterized protein (DUF58 family)